MTESDDLPVVIAGAGPAGLATAITLGHLGVPTLLLERRTTRSTEPRANLVNTGPMEQLRRWGLEAEVAAAALDVEMTGLRTTTLADTAGGAPFPIGTLTRAEAAELSPTRPWCIGQDQLEPILERHVARLPSVRVIRGAEVTAVAQDSSGVDVTVEGAAAPRTVRAAHLVAADGIRSGIRAAAGIGTVEQTGLSDSIGLRFRAPLWSSIDDGHRHTIYALTDPVAGGALIPGGGDRWTYATARRPGVEPTIASLVPLIRRATGFPDMHLKVERVIELAYATALADSFRARRIFLVGDAAHQVTPRGGTGMNMALRDGHALGWRLGWVRRGWATDELLDDYEDERRRVAVHNVNRSAHPDGSVRDSTTEWRFDTGERIPHVWVAPGRSTLDLIGPHWTLFGGPDTDAGDRRVHRLTAHAADALGIGRRGTLRVRPDGVPADR